MWLEYLYKEIPKETASDICRLNRTKGNILKMNHSSVGMIEGKVMSIELFEFQCLFFFFLRIRAYHLSSVGWESIEGIFVVVTKIKQTVNVSVIFPISLF